MRYLFALLALAAPLAFASPAHDALVKEVGDTERAFAATMKARDFAGFVDFLSDEAVFGAGNLVGKEAIATRWKEFYKNPQAPFSWEPDKVVVLASGTLAYTSGPVHDPSGKLTGRFNSVWRKEPNGKWKIVFDSGEQVCACKAQ